MTMPSPVLEAWVRGIGIIAPGMPDWVRARPVLEGRLPHADGPLEPGVPDMLPAAERRRAGAVIRLAVSVAQQAVRSAAVDMTGLASVFASADGDGENVHQICLALASGHPEISPTRFHNSVQNAASGYWSIATRSHAPSTTVNGLDAVFAAGFLEAMVQSAIEARDVLLVAFDLPMPEPLHALRPIPSGCAVALVLGHAPAPDALARLRVRCELPAGSFETSMGDAALERARLANPAARALPLLAAVARRESRTVHLTLDAHAVLAVDVAPHDA